MQHPWHTADFFVLRLDNAGWDECKPAPDLQRLAHQQPHRYVLDQDGSWRCPPGEAYAAALGLTYRVRSSDQICWNAQANCLYLEDYFRHANNLTVADAVRAALLAAVDAQPGISLANLRATVTSATADDLHALIVRGDLYVDLNTHRVAEAERTPVYLSEGVARAYTVSATPNHLDDPSGALLTLPGPSRMVDLVSSSCIAWDGVPWRIANVGERDLTLLPLEHDPEGVSRTTDPLAVPRAAFEH